MSTLMVAISTHGAYAPYLPKAIETARRFSDYVHVYDDGGECAEVVPRDVDYTELDKTGKCVMARKQAIDDAIRLGYDQLLHLDGDDWLLARPMLPRPYAFAYADIYLCDEKDSLYETWKYTGRPTTYMEVWPWWLSTIGTTYGRMPICGKCVFSVDFLKANRLSWYQFPNTDMGEDVRTFLEYFRHKPEFIYIPDAPFYVYRQHAIQETKNTYKREPFMRDCDDYLLNSGCCDLRIHAIGDSHALHTGSYFVVHHIADKRGQGATAHNLIEPDSATGSNRKVLHLLDTLDSEHDVLMLMFGEVDCRFHLRNHKQITETVERYGRFIELLQSRGFRVIVCSVIGAVPRGNDFERVADYPSATERGSIVNAFNALLSEWCYEHAVEFMDTQTYNADGTLDAELTDDGVHLRDDIAREVFSPIAHMQTWGHK